jgi:hypothetical protein
MVAAAGIGTLGALAALRKAMEEQASHSRRVGYRQNAPCGQTGQGDG